MSVALISSLIANSRIPKSRSKHPFAITDEVLISLKAQFSLTLSFNQENTTLTTLKDTCLYLKLVDRNAIFPEDSSDERKT